MNRKQRRSRTSRRSAAKPRSRGRTVVPAQAFARAVRLHQAGRPDEARAAYRRILADRPKHAGALHYLGVIAFETGDADQAADLIGKALAVDPEDATAHFNLGLALRDQGRLEQAVQSYRRALEIRDDFPEVHANLGIGLSRLGRHDQAVACYRRGLELKPEDPVAHSNLGFALTEQGDYAQAVASCRRALELKPDYPEALSNLGNALKNQGKLDQAVAAYRRALELRPDYPEALSNLGVALKEQGRLDEAVAAYRRALALKPDYPEAHSNLGNALTEQGKLDQALASCRRALKLRPDYAEAHWNLSLALLLLGRFEEGWAAYEWRWRKKDRTPRGFRQPPWRGDDLGGRSILLHAEQGLGDAIQFVRFAPLVADRGGRVILEAPKPLRRLFAASTACARVIARGDEPPAFDCHAPLMSLPHLLGTRLESIPAAVPYLEAEPDRVAAWRDRLGGRPGLRVGIVWQGNPRHKNDRIRSCPLHHFEALARRDDLTFYSLQVGPVAADLEDLGVDAPIHDMGTQLNDFADTAAVVAQLDLVITVDTAMAHLAGALARPVWTLLPFVPDWRWLLGRDDSPWYPTMRLFRQPAPGAWEQVFERVAEALRERVSAARPSVR